jgi:hypothetical protein
VRLLVVVGVLCCCVVALLLPGCYTHSLTHSVARCLLVVSKVSSLLKAGVDKEEWILISIADTSKWCE